MHASSKKEGIEEYFAEMQLFSPWHAEDLLTWRKTDACIKEFQECQEKTHKVRSKTFPFSMQEFIEKIRLQEALNNVEDDIKDRLDGQGAQDNEDVIAEGLEEIQRPEIDFSEWHDDSKPNECNAKGDSNKFRTLELQSMDQFLATKKSLVPEQTKDDYN